ncbi:7-carboxy-7-deazaguanine synthase QueE [Streptomyces sp. NPDC050617]|uniref:7-carboxy-7-deazaguanine synthase QueE n=1 Tax=Streptomyces sp. NPDC050617 TaxID=3154628 RepID=UPI00341D747E
MTSIANAARALEPSLVVSEVFGPTWQGEGPSLGRLAVFLRLGHCNLTCEWCDTPYTWDWTRHEAAAELTVMTVDSAVRQVARVGAPLLVITGGEPLMQQQALGTLLGRLPPGIDAEIETNGTIVPTEEIRARVARFNVSPKLANSGVRDAKRVRSRALAELNATGKAMFKFVVSSAEDLAEVGRIVEEYSLKPVYIMPEGTNSDAILQGLRDMSSAILERGWNITPRLHVLIWGDQRGV